jgi:error-prone DNA polymerase
MIDGLRETFGRTIERTRDEHAFTSIDDFTRRTGLGQAVVKRLAEADAFGSLGANRRQALWESLGQERKPLPLPLFDTPQIADPSWGGSTRKKTSRRPGPEPGQEPGQDGRAILPAMSLAEEVVADYRTAGLSLRAHPISFHRRELDRLGVTTAAGLAELANETQVRVAGLVLLRQRPGTAKGITFVTLEDETGTANLVVHQRTWDRYYRVARGAPAWIAHGHVQTTRDDPSGHKHAAAVIHVVVRRLEALAEGLGALEIKSRDFR